MQLTAREIAAVVGGKLVGNPEIPVTGVAGIKEARPSDATFVGSPKYAAALKTTHAAVILLTQALADSVVGQLTATLVVVENPMAAFARLVEKITPPPVRFPPGSFMLGAPAVPHKEFKKVNAATQRLPETLVKLRDLEQQLAEIRDRLSQSA